MHKHKQMLSFTYNKFVEINTEGAIVYELYTCTYDVVCCIINFMVCVNKLNAINIRCYLLYVYVFCISIFYFVHKLLYAYEISQVFSNYKLYVRSQSCSFVFVLRKIFVCLQQIFVEVASVYAIRY